MTTLIFCILALGLGFVLGWNQRQWVTDQRFQRSIERDMIDSLKKVGINAEELFDGDMLEATKAGMDRDLLKLLDLGGTKEAKEVLIDSLRTFHRRWANNPQLKSYPNVKEELASLAADAKESESIRIALGTS